MTSTAQDGDDWVGRYVVRVRRLADLSQRDLAAETGTSASRVCRLESGALDPGVTQFQRILDLAGLRLAVVDTEGREVPPVPADAVRDNQGRRFPAHLDVAPPDEVPYDRWSRPRYDRPDARGWYHLRTARDEFAGGTGDGERPADHPTNGELSRRRHLMRGRQPRVDAPPPPDIVCECLDACFEERCVAPCPCQCEPRAGAGSLRHRLVNRSLECGDAGRPPTSPDRPEES